MRWEPEFEHKPELQCMFSWIVPGMRGARAPSIPGLCVALRTSLRTFSWSSATADTFLTQEGSKSRLRTYSESLWYSLHLVISSQIWWCLRTGGGGVLTRARGCSVSAYASSTNLQIKKWSFFNVYLSSGQKISLFSPQIHLRRCAKEKKTVTVLSFFVCRWFVESNHKRWWGWKSLPKIQTAQNWKRFEWKYTFSQKRKSYGNTGQGNL